MKLTADCTSVMVLGDPGDTGGDSSRRRAAVLHRGSSVDTGRRASLGDLKSFATSWAFKVQTSASWSGVAYDATAAALPRVESCEAIEVILCAESEEERRRWLEDLTTELRVARRQCLRICAPLSPEDFGREALLAEGLQSDHDANRYAAALEAVIDQRSEDEPP